MRNDEDERFQCGTVGMNNNQSSQRLYVILCGPRNWSKIASMIYLVVLFHCHLEDNQ